MESLSPQQIKHYAKILPEVKKVLQALDHQDLWWTTVAMVGKINNENMDPQLLESIVSTQEEFQNLRNRMIQALIDRYFNQANSELALKAQAAIDMLNRNLYERTADVGFLATDEDLVAFMVNEHVQAQDEAFILQRLQEYVAKYSVYDDVLLLTPSGQVKAKLNSNNPVRHSQDPLLEEALNTQSPYIEVYRYSDLFPNKPQSLIYAKRIESQAGQTKQTVGVLCLSFEFAEEMQSIFTVLNAPNTGEDTKSTQHGSSHHAMPELMLVDDKGQVLAQANPTSQTGQTSTKVVHKVAKPVKMTTPNNSATDISFTTSATGYQGFMGQAWYSFIRASHQVAFNKDLESAALHIEIGRDSPIYLHELEEMNLKVSTLLHIVILNGKMTSLKRQIKSFLPILDGFKDISEQIQTVFNDFIEHIHQVVLNTIATKVTFSAKLAVELMDRNLYERANDCRWWALNSRFREYLTQRHHNTPLTESQILSLQQTLKYINDLYTVYTNILLYDANGEVIAVSNPEQSEFCGQRLAQTEITAGLKLTSTQAYVVSEFVQTPLYDNQPTYVYHAAVKDWHNPEHNVGGIALIFDSQPEFKAMLADTLPQYRYQALDASTFALFVDRQGGVIASTHDAYAPGCRFDLPGTIAKADNGASGAIEWQEQEHKYMLGFHVSNGYREYKQEDGYQNDVIALVFTAI